MEMTLWVAFGAGLLSFFSPCIIPLVPTYLASLAGPELLDTEAKRNRFPVFFHSLTFVIGFSLVFSLLGAAAGLVGSVFNLYSSVIIKIAGGLLIAFGLLMLAALKVPWLNYERRLNPSLGSFSGYLRSFIIGAIFPLAWIPCTSWILGGILILAGTSETAWHGAYLLMVYSLGLGLPFLIVGIAFDFIRPFLRSISRYSSWMYIISGLLLVGMGILFLTNNMNWFLILIEG